MACRLLIYDPEDRKPRVLLAELLGQRDITVNYTRDRDLFEGALAQRNHDVCLIFLRSDPGRVLADTLARARAHRRLGAAISIHAVASPTATRAMLELGVGQVLIEPVTPQRILRAIDARLGGPSPHPTPLGALLQQPPATCELRIPGRVRRLSRARPGELFVEMDAVVDIGATITLVGPFAAALDRPALSLQVLSRQVRDLVEHHHGYWCVDTAGPPDVWREFLRREPSPFGLASPKVLWISERRLADVERLLPPEKYSLELARPGAITGTFLTRVDPAAVVIDAPAGNVQALVAAWSEGQPDRPVLATHACPFPLLPLEPTEFPLVWGAHRPTARVDEETAYLDAAAPISRCAISAPAELTGLSVGAFEINTALRVGADTLIEVRDSPIGDRNGFGVFGRVSDTHLGSSPGLRLSCLALPISNDRSLSLTRAHHAAPVEAYTSPEGTVRAPLSVPVSWLAAAALVAGLVYWANEWVSRPAAEPVVVSNGPALDGFRSAFH